MNWIRILAILATVTLLAAGARETSAQNAAPAAWRLHDIVDGFSRQSTPDQFRQLGDALVMSPALTRQLSGAAAAGHLTGMEIASPQRRSKSPFAATIDRGRILFAADFLPLVAKKRLSDVAYRDDILPNNLVFVLGSLAFHLQTRPVSMSSDTAGFAKASIEKDALSFIQGWNNVIDAALLENGHQPLTPQQQATLLLNLRYRMVFLDQNNQAQVAMASSGAIDPTEGNVAAVVGNLRRVKLLDFGVLARE